MRLKPIPDWLGVAIVAPFAICVVPVVATCFAFAGLVWLKRKAIGPTKAWRRWFAWYPANLGDYFDGDWRWLEMVERQSFGIMSDTHFRAALNPTPERTNDEQVSLSPRPKPRGFRDA